MKITGGGSRGRVLLSLKGMDIRPTSSKVREAIFNILGQDMSGLIVLDVFAGTGILGIEALSRGAARAVFIDKSNRSVDLVKKNLALCGYEDVSMVLKRDIMNRATLGLLAENRKFDIVFIDPPYGKGIIPPVLGMLSDCNILTPDAVVVAESAKDDPLPEGVGTLVRSGARIYGDTKIDFYEREHDL
jgi:16S rRNA (guanine966-N2)-methyltransferase